ncbi:hypothetical protein D3C87_76730 [compost metagenome]
MSSKYYNAIIKKINSTDTTDVRYGMEAAVVYLTSNRQIAEEERKTLMEYVKRDLHWLDDYCNKKEPTKDQLSFAIEKFEKRPDLIFRYQTLSYKVFTKESRKAFIEKNRNKLIEISIKQNLMKMLDYIGKITYEDTKFIVKKISTSNIPYTFILQFMHYIKTENVLMDEEDRDAVDAIIVMNELFSKG